MANILVPDYLGQQVISGIRSLWREGDTVDAAYAFHPLQNSLFGSRAVRKYFRIHEAEDEEAYLHDILELHRRERYDLAIPFGLSAYYALSKNRQRLWDAGLKTFLPPFEALTLANDKEKMTEFCRKIGIDTPRTYTTYEENDLEEIAGTIRYPAVVKARGGSGVAKGLRYAENRDELIRGYKEIHEQPAGASFTPEHPIIQEFVPGNIHDACTLTAEGEVLTVLTQVRELMHPIDGGVGAVNITTHEPELAEAARRVLHKVGWNGPAQVEFKLDERDGKYKFIELNPKLWGTLDLSIKSGFPFPNWVRDVLEGHPEKVRTEYREGNRYIFTFPQAFYARRQLSAHPEYRDKLKRFPYSQTFTDFDRADPMPDLYRRLIYPLRCFVDRPGKKPILPYRLFAGE